MAKVTISLEDQPQDDTVLVRLDLSQVPMTLTGGLRQTGAVRLSEQLFSLASFNTRLEAFPAHARHYGSTTIH